MPVEQAFVRLMAQLVDIYIALKDKRLSAFDKVLFVYLRIKAGKKKKCWPCYETIMTDCGIVSRNSLSRSIKKMAGLRLFKIGKIFENGKRHNLYIFQSTATQYFEKECFEVDLQLSKVRRKVTLE